MKKIFTLFLTFCVVTFAIGQSNNLLRDVFEKKIYIDSLGTVLNYRFLTPKNYNDTTFYPLVLFLHGAGERGHDNESQLNYVDKVFGSEVFREKFPCYVVLPQCDSAFRWCETNWSLLRHNIPKNPSVYLSATNQLVDSLIDCLNVDISRLYITGMSMGGFGTWDLISRYPQKFAAAIPICGGADENMACRLKDIPIRTYHGAIDKLVKVSRTRNIVTAIRNCGGKKIYYKEYPKSGHLIWNKVYAEPGLFEWLFSQKKDINLDYK